MGYRVIAINLILSLCFVGKVVIAEQQLKSKHAKITGHCYVTKGGGESMLLRDLEISLVPFTDQIREDTKKIEQAKQSVYSHATMELPSQSIGCRGFEEKVQWVYPRITMCKRASIEFRTYYSESAKYSTRSDFEALYQFDNVKLGSYLIFAYLRTTSSGVYWLEQIEVTEGKTYKLDLTSSNTHQDEILDYALNKHESMYQLARTMDYVWGCGPRPYQAIQDAIDLQKTMLTEPLTGEFAFPKPNKH